MITRSCAISLNDGILLYRFVLCNYYINFFTIKYLHLYKLIPVNKRFIDINIINCNMRFLYYSFIMNALRMKPSMNLQLAKESFVGTWFVRENGENKIIHLKPHGVIYQSTIKKSDYVGYWETNADIFYFNLRDNDVEKKYYGKIFNNTLNISGEVCEGITSPNYINKFTMMPLFEQFHNISYMNDTDTSTYLNQNNVTGNWLLENIHTNKLYILELYLNNTWNSVNLNYTGNKLSGKWNLFNETNEINTNTAIKYSGKNIWLNIKKDNDQSYVTYDIIFLGKIVQLGNMQYANEDKVVVSSKINGSVVYGFDMEPEISETFYMKRWFND